MTRKTPSGYNLTSRTETYYSSKEATHEKEALHRRVSRRDRWRDCRRFAAQPQRRAGRDQEIGREKGGRSFRTVEEGPRREEGRSSTASGRYPAERRQAGRSEASDNNAATGR